MQGPFVDLEVVLNDFSASHDNNRATIETGHKGDCYYGNFVGGSVAFWSSEPVMELSGALTRTNATAVRTFYSCANAASRSLRSALHFGTSPAFWHPSRLMVSL